MKSVVTASLVAIITIGGLTGCASDGVNRQDVGLVAGGVAGGLLGNAVTNGGAAGTIIGAVGGAWAGQEIAKKTN